MAEGGGDEDIKEFAIEQLSSSSFLNQMNEINENEREVMHHTLDQLQNCAIAVASITEALHM